jgi:hypothetical protein
MTFALLENTQVVRVAARFAQGRGRQCLRMRESDQEPANRVGALLEMRGNLLQAFAQGRVEAGGSGAQHPDRIRLGIRQRAPEQLELAMGVDGARDPAGSVAA